MLSVRKPSDFEGHRVELEEMAKGTSGLEGVEGTGGTRSRQSPSLPLGVCAELGGRQPAWSAYCLFTSWPPSRHPDEPCRLVSFPLGKNWGKLHGLEIRRQTCYLGHRSWQVLPQDFPGPSERRGEMRGQTWAGWETLESLRQLW